MRFTLQSTLRNIKTNSTKRFFVHNAVGQRSNIPRIPCASKAHAYFLLRMPYQSARYYSSSGALPTYRSWPWGFFLFGVAVAAYAMSPLLSVEAEEMSDEEKIEAYMAEAKKHLDDGNLEKFVDCFNRILEIRSDDADLLFEMGNLCYRYRNKYNDFPDFSDLILFLYTQSIEKNSEHVCVYMKRGIFFEELGYLKEALADYDEVIRRDSKHVAAHINRGVVLGKLGRLQEALIDFNQAIVCNSEGAEAYYNRGILFGKLG